MTRWRTRPTARGVALAVAGPLAAVAAVVLGLQVLLFPAVLLVLLPVASWLVTLATPPRLRVTRELVRDTVSRGEEVRGAIAVRGAGRVPGGAVRVAQPVPAEWGAARTWRVPSGGHADLAFGLSGGHRGRWSLGAVRVSWLDPLGLARAEATAGGDTEFFVLPDALPVEELTGDGTSGGRGDSDGGGPGDGDPEADASVREYRAGDERRAIHWRSTARLGTLMVRDTSEGGPAQPAVAVVDCRPDADPGAFERTVSRAAWWCAVEGAAGRPVTLLPRAPGTAGTTGRTGPPDLTGPAGDPSGTAIREVGRGLAGLRPDDEGWARVLDACRARRAWRVPPPALVVLTPRMDRSLARRLDELDAAWPGRPAGTVVADSRDDGADPGPGWTLVVPGRAPAAGAAS